ncbi:MAG: DHH family phosphoesterase [Planctomycetota bacterium]|jgi:phosphoesterase RecJ-like protein
MISRDDFEKAAELVSNSSRILITSHVRPDGDACGSAIALWQTLKDLGKDVKTIMLSEVPRWYEFLFVQKAAVLGSDISLEQLKSGRFCQPDLIIILDTNSYGQLSDFQEYLKDSKAAILIIDHHITSDGLGDVELIDTSAAATGLIIFEFLKYANRPITKRIADCLFVAAATDTGWFQFNNTDSRVFKVCAELINAGVNPTQVYHDLYQNCSFARIRLMTAMFNTLQLELDGRYATQRITQKDVKQTGATYNDTENFIDECRRIKTVQAAALFVELPDGRIKCSLRSQGDIDVRQIAQKFGGGGHKMASGLQMDGPIEQVEKLVFEQVAEQFSQLDRISECLNKNKKKI